MSDVTSQNDADTAIPPSPVLSALARRSIVLVGMMGVGKSSVGRRLAARLSIPFIDADSEIEKAAGMTIPEIFARHGEPYFRSGEARVIARLLESGPQVLATGGGAFMNPDTRALIKLKGVSVWLHADFDVLMRRTSKRRSDRPLLQTENPDETLRALLAEREPTYALADLTVQSREVPHEAIVADVMTALAAYLKVASALRPSRRPHDRSASHRPDHRAGRARRPQLRHRHRPRADRVARLPASRLCGRGARVFIVTDTNIELHHLDAVEETLAESAIAASQLIVPPGEGSKSFRVFEQVCEAIIAARIERGDLVIALGGGVIGDLAGFAASAVRRGIDYVQVPTTLLAQVDSSVGGKTAINSAHGKNLVGAFHQPIFVVADTALLDTLPPREFRAGYAEVAKYGLLGDAAFFSWLEANWREVFAGGKSSQEERGARARHRGELPRQGCDRGARRARDRRPGAS